jgi:hypothetical protein
MAEAVRRGLAFDAAQGGQRWCHHLHYTELMKDPVGAVETLYAHFGERVSELHRRRMEVWMRDRSQSAFGRHRYDLADFALSADALDRAYAPYRERFGVAREAR